ncbi:hypothetical protein C1I93_00615 [Micromonospora endophytica]|uniref:RICIN domain-containing protein n=1 Tax=Micromonospora endophytica TaxID=515350 RepID=A0A2W2D6B7_9ACTN|nr:hypothetical protein C1I93_00615 [Micromonospora endophytica]RIW47996.1 hypothetical protein D3H59_08635 [Micromonospora endophytica]
MLVRRWLAGAGLVALIGGAAAFGVTLASADDAPADRAGPAAELVPVAKGGPAAEVAPAAAVDPVLSGKRRITIVRVGAFESGLSLFDGGRLAEVDGDEGRQVFVPTPIGSGQYLIKAYQSGGTGKPVCWQVHNPGDTNPLFVRGATCRTNDPAQRFEISPADEAGPREYVISNRSAFLRTTARNGLTMEELGDATPFDSFRFNDNGPAPRQ